MKLPILFVVVFVVFSCNILGNFCSRPEFKIKLLSANRFILICSDIFICLCHLVQIVDALEGNEADEIRRIFEDVLENSELNCNTLWSEQELKLLILIRSNSGDRKINEKLDLILRLISNNVDVNGKTPLHTLVTSNGKNSN